MLLLHAGRAGARRGVVSDVVSEPRGISLVGSGAASEDCNGGGKPAVVATATQSPTSRWLYTCIHIENRYQDAIHKIQIEKQQVAERELQGSQNLLCI